MRTRFFSSYHGENPLFSPRATGSEPLSDKDALGDPAPLQPYLFLLLPIGVAAVLSFYSLGVPGFWLDEAASVTWARLDWSAMWRVIRIREPNMAFYHILLHFWLKFGTGEFAARSLSAVLAVLSIFPVYAIGVRLFAPTTAVAASLLLALNAFFIRYAQEARGYALFFFLAACASYSFLRALDQPSWKNWGLYILTGALCIYTHFFAVWVLASHCISGAAFRRYRAQSLSIVLVHALIGVAASPLLIPIMEPDSHTSHLGWLATPSLGKLVELFGTLSGSGEAVTAIAYGLACGYALFCAWMRRSKNTSHTWSFVFLLNWMLFPIVASFLFSLVFKPIFLPRYLIPSLAPFVLIAAVGLENVRPPWAKAIALLLMIVLSGRSVANLYGEGARIDREPWRAVA